nr:MAG: cysteine-rich VLP protein [Bacteriophage sp.]
MYASGEHLRQTKKCKKLPFSSPVTVTEEFYFPLNVPQLWRFYPPPPSTIKHRRGWQSRVRSTAALLWIGDDDMSQRELTRQEKAAIRKLVIPLCANYDREYGCLPLDCECYMLGKYWTGALCRYFREAVLPTNPKLEAALTTGGPAEKMRPCAVCGHPFIPEGKRMYCSKQCAKAARRKRQREYMRKVRTC